MAEDQANGDVAVSRESRSRRHACILIHTQYNNTRSGHKFTFFKGVAIVHTNPK